MLKFSLLILYYDVCFSSLLYWPLAFTGQCIAHYSVSVEPDNGQHGIIRCYGLAFCCCRVVLVASEIPGNTTVPSTNSDFCSTNTNHSCVFLEDPVFQIRGKSGKRAVQPGGSLQVSRSCTQVTILFCLFLSMQFLLQVNQKNDCGNSEL